MYRIVEPGDTTEAREIARFESAYAAVARMRQALLTSTEDAARWQLLDSSGVLLADAADVLDGTG